MEPARLVLQGVLVLLLFSTPVLLGLWLSGALS
jgi:hypothetical protein